MEITLSLEPKPTPRPRFFKRGKFVSVYQPPEYTAWKAKAVELLQSIPSPGIFRGPVAVTIRTFTTRPKKTVRITPAGDVDNHAKGILDAITQSERFWEDDQQVQTLTVSKEWTPGPGYITVNIKEA